MDTNRPINQHLLANTKIVNTKQDGGVLIVSLLVLLVLTLIGVSSLDSSVMEEKMASNAQISTTVFQTAESAIREKYFEESEAPAMAVMHAQNNAQDDCASCDSVDSDIAGSTEMVYPDSVSKPPLFNSSAGTFVAHGIEIVGSASYRGINDSNAQGFSVYPMRP